MATLKFDSPGCPQDPTIRAQLRQWFADRLKGMPAGMPSNSEARAHYMRSSNAHHLRHLMSERDHVITHAVRCGLSGPVGRLP